MTYLSGGAPAAIAIQLGAYMTVTEDHPQMLRGTKVWTIWDRDGGILGYVSWSRSWRQYVFSPSPACDFSAGCLTEIVGFIGEQMRARATSAAGRAER